MPGEFLAALVEGLDRIGKEPNVLVELTVGLVAVEGCDADQGIKGFHRVGLGDVAHGGGL